MEALRAGQRRLRAEGRDADAAAIGLKISEAEELEAKMLKQRAVLALFSVLNGLWSTGGRVNTSNDDLEARTKLLKTGGVALSGHDAIDWCRTPSERLRYMLGQGRAMMTTADRATDYNAFAERLRAYVAFAQEESEQDLVETFGPRLWSCVQWARAGGNQFEITRDLAAALLLTTVPKTERDEPRLPYDTLALTLPPGAVPFMMPNAETEWADTLWIERRGDKTLLIVRWQILELHWVIDDHFEVDESDDAASLPEDEVTKQAAVRLVRNFAIWLDAEGGVKKHRPEVVPKKLLEKRARGNETWPRHWLFGKEVKISPELRRAASEIVLGRAAERQVEGWHVRARFTVRGHWRNQVHGAGRMLRRRQWIAPFWKGPSEKEAWAHLYKPAEKL